MGGPAIVPHRGSAGRNHARSASRCLHALRRAMAWIGLTGALLAACSAPPPIVGVENPEIASEQVPGSIRHPVLVATSRALAEDPALFYDADRGALVYAGVDVVVPPSHQRGQIERPQDLPPDPRTEFLIEDPRSFVSSGAFQAELTRRLRQRPAAARDVLVFVHGYNTTLSEALLQVGQYVEDTGYTGVSILFSWASSGQTLKYVYDLNSAIIARDGFVDLMQVLEATPGIRGYDVVAHSMGALVTMEAVRQIALDPAFSRSGRLQNIVLASPDIDLDLFRAQLAAIPEDRRRIVILTSEDDRALDLSSAIAGGVKRVGQATPAELEGLGVITIDLSQIDDTGSVNHSKFAQAPEVVKLVGEQINLGNTFATGQLSPGDALVLGVTGAVGAVESIATDP